MEHFKMNMNDSNTLSQVSPGFSAFNIEKELSFIRPYNPSAVEIPGYRHAVIRFRYTENNKKAGLAEKPAQMCTVPVLVIPTDWKLPEQALKVLQGVLEDGEDTILKVRVEAKDSLVHWQDIGLAKVLDNLTAERVSQRLTREGLEAWAKVAMTQVCTERAMQIAEAKGFNAEQASKQVAGTIKRYFGLVASMSAPVPGLKQEEAIALQNILTVSKLDDDIAKILKKKLHAMLNPEVATGDL